ncbi:zinc finger protein [Elysia marginata]|uniref:Zinc finger protein n=1 Tax=Elysia marginata TaxID=1093978 RepID=A0AAV4FW27_9GAST|nr:zinc finger protein [Elysia marginata]
MSSVMLRPIPIHLQQTLAPHPPPPVVLEGLHFHPYPLGSLLPLRTSSLITPNSGSGAACLNTSADESRSRPCQPVELAQTCQLSSKISPSSQPSQSTKAAKPLWNPALDLTINTTHNSPRKGDTADSLAVVTSNLYPETAITLTSYSRSSNGDGSTAKEGTGGRERAPLNQSIPLPTETIEPERNETVTSSVQSNKTPHDHPSNKQRQEDSSSRCLASESNTRKRKDPGSHRCQSPAQPKSLSQHHKQRAPDKLDRDGSPDGKTGEDNHTQSQRNLQDLTEQAPHNLTRDIGVLGGLGCVTTDSEAYQHFHHQHRLALLASNLLQMGSHGPGGLLGHHAHPHLLPSHLQHRHPHHHHHHHNNNNHQISPCTTTGFPHRPGLSLQSALALAQQSRGVLERLSATTAFTNSSSAYLPVSCDHHCHPSDSHNHTHHSNMDDVHTAHQRHIQQSKHTHKETHPAAPCSSSSSAPSSVPLLPHPHKAEKLHPPHSLALQNALARLLSPHGGNAPVGGAGSLVGAAAGLGMGVAINSGGAAGGGASYGRKLFPCPQCRYTTDRRNNLKRHMLTMHQTSSKMLECCGILFSTKASLREHAMIFHYHGYTCYFCGRRFCRKALLKRHLSVHNGQKDFVCTICDYATSHKSNLERHRKVHTRQEGEDDNGAEEGERIGGNEGFRPRYHDDMKSNGSEAISHEDVSEDELSVDSDGEDDIDVEIDVHND